MSNKQESNTSLTSGLSGLLAGILLAVLYIKFGFSLPGWLHPEEHFKGKLISMAASFSVDDNDIEELQREIALQMQDPDNYIEIDNALGGFITEELIWRSKLQRAVNRLQDHVKNLQRFKPDSSEAIQQSLQRLLDRLPGKTRGEKKLLADFLHNRFPGATDTKIIEQLGQLSLSDLLQIPSPAIAIVLSIGTPGNISVRLFDRDDRIIKNLLQADLPAGKYRLYWDFTNEHGLRVANTISYRYEIHVNDQLKQTGDTGLPQALGL